MSAGGEDDGVHVLCILRAATNDRPLSEDDPIIVALHLDPEGWAQLDAARRHLASMPEHVRSLEIACPGIVVWLTPDEVEGATVARLRRAEPESPTVCTVKRDSIVLAAPIADATVNAVAWRADDGLEDVLVRPPGGDGVLVGDEADAWLESSGIELPQAIEQIEQLIELERLVAAVESAAGLLQRASAMTGP
ncbi:hypothetical protein [Dolichospermum phage Dfl-JY45]